MRIYTLFATENVNGRGATSNGQKKYRLAGLHR